MIDSKLEIQFIKVEKLIHIEQFSKKRVAWLKKKILKENMWKVPIKVEKNDFLIMDGQHRTEVAIELNFKILPCIFYSYDEVKVWSLRTNHIVNPALIREKSLSGDIYPYKTAKHLFPFGNRSVCEISLEELKG
jgi:L-serine kinase (ADP)